ncbi:choice-of-anchor U domain-containing protein, partial [Candidatus Methanodesulfokora washburnensis]|uniref:choice-of-anchor U domain-containing protein n=1 Tax=Candidatus Methanodesulfokora washburnensis TaxID=2478471 RepID=UPI001387112F
MVKARPACNIYLTGGNLSVQLLNGSYDEKTLKINTSGFPLGIYRLVNKCGNETAETEFTLDELIIKAFSPEPNKLKVDVISKLLGKPVNATVYVNGSRYNGTFVIKPGILNIHANLSSISAEKEVEVPNISMKNYYAPWDEIKVKISSVERPNITVITPLNFSFTLNVSRSNSTWIARFRLPQPVALGTYRLHVRLGGIELAKNFTVTMDEIEVRGEQKGLRWILNISAFDVLKKSPVNGIVEINGEKMKMNGTLIYETDKTELRIHLVDSRGIEANRTVKLDLVFSERNTYALGEKVRIFSTGDVILLGPGIKEALNKSRYNETFFLSVYVAEKSGNYSLICGNASYSFSVYPVNWSFNGSLLRIESPVGGNLTVMTCSNTSRIKFNGSISLNVSAPSLIKIEELNFTLRIPGISIDRNVHFPKERVEICALGNTTVVSPSGRLLINRSIDKPEIVQIWLNQTVELGNYTVKADSEERKFTVDSYSIRARAVGRRIEGNVSYYFVMPDYISYEINGKEGRAAVVNGSFEINATDEGTYKLRCGNAAVNITRDVKVENGFVNRTMRVNVSFIPVESYLKLGNSSYKLNFTNGTAEFIPRKAGVYTVFVDGIERSLIVDNYEIRAVLDGDEVRGNVSYLFIPPVDVEYLLLPLNKSGKANVVNGSFSFKVGNITAVLLRCGNAELRITKAKSIVVENVTLRISVDKGEIEELKAEEDRIWMKISRIEPGDKVKVVIEFPFEIPSGLYIYYWKILGNRTIPVNCTVVGNRIEFYLQDGVLDEDNEKNGVIVDPIKVYIPEIRAESSFSGKNGLITVIGKRSYNITVHIDRGRIEKLALVDPRNMPFRPVDFPFYMIKLRIGNISGDSVRVEVGYPHLNGSAGFYLFNPRDMSWNELNVTQKNSTVILELKDGITDEDGVKNGRIEIDGGVFIKEGEKKWEKLGFREAYDPIQKKALIFAYLNDSNITDIINNISELTEEIFLNGKRITGMQANITGRVLEAFLKPNISSLNINELSKIEIHQKYIKIGDRLRINVSLSSKIEGINLRIRVRIPNGSVVTRIVRSDGKIIYSFGDEGVRGFVVYLGDGEIAFYDDPSYYYIVDVGFPSNWGATIYRGNNGAVPYNYHTYILHVPVGLSSFTLGVYDGDYGFTYSGTSYYHNITVYRPDGSVYGVFHASGNEVWYYQTINTNVPGNWSFTWRQDGWPSSNGNYYGLSIPELKTMAQNMSYTISGVGYRGTYDAMIVGEETGLSLTQEWYVIVPRGTTSFSVAVYDGDRILQYIPWPPWVQYLPALNISVYNPYGNLVASWQQPLSNEAWDVLGSVNTGGINGAYRIVVRQIRDYDDYSTGGNMYRLATSISSGIWLGNPTPNLSVTSTSWLCSHQGRSFILPVTVKNTGYVGLKGITITLSLPSNWIANSTSYTINGWIWPNGSRTVYFQITVPSTASPGNYTVNVAASHPWVNPSAVNAHDKTSTTVVIPYINLSIRKSISGGSSNIITVKNNANSLVCGITAYSFSPTPASSFSVQPNGSYSWNGGTIYYWNISLLSSLSSWTASYSADETAESFMLGIDPPSTDKGLKIDVKEFSSVIFYPNGSYSVRELWGFLTLNNTSPDIISDISIYINGTGYAFYPDYPNASSSPVYPPLHFPLLLPSSYARWRYTAPKEEAFVPLRFIERNMSCGALISIQALDDVENVVIRKMGLVYTVGNMKKGDTRNITLNLSFSGCIQQNATVEFSYKNASLLKRINRIRALGPAEIQIRKEIQGNRTKVAAYMRNTASSLVYRLDKICIMRSESGPILLCESPSKVLKPGDLYETKEFSENITGIPKYYANATFTMLPSINGVTVPLQSITSVYYIAAAVLVEPVICCIPAPPAPAPPPPVPPAPPTPAVNVTPAAPAANVTANITAKPVMVPVISIFKSADKYRAYVGDIVRFTITVRNSGNGTWEGDVTDSLPGELRYAGASSARGNVTGPSVSGGTLSWHVVLSPGHEASISYQAVVASYPSSGYVENIAVAAGSRSSAHIEIVKPIRVADIRKAGELSGREITYVISVVSTNYEGSLTVVDYLPEGLSYIPGATLDGSPYEPAVQGNKLTWSIYIGKNQTRVIKFSAHIEKVYGVDVVNTA